MKKIFKLLTAGSLLLAVSSLISRILGVYRDHLFAKYFGVSESLDAYYAAFTIPDLLYALLIMSSISAIFLPMFQKYKVKENWDEAWKFTSSVLNTLVLFFAALAGVLTLGADVLVSFYVPNFSAEQQELTASMIRIMMLSPLFFLFSSIMISVENAFQKFFAQALAPILYNVGIIVGVVYLSQSFGIEGVAYGVVLGAILQMLIQIPFFLQTGFKWSCNFLKGKQLREMAVHFWPRLLSVSITHVSLAANVVIAAMLTTGAVTLYNLSFNIQSFTYGMIAVSLSIPAFALLTQKAAEKDTKGFQMVLKNTFEKTLFWMLPANIGLYIVAEPLIKLLLEYGAFTAADTLVLTHLVQIYAIGLMFTGVIILLVKAYLAMQKTWFVTFVGLGVLVVDILVSIVLAFQMGVEGLVWGTVIAFVLKTIILIGFAWKDFGSLFDCKNLFKITVLSFALFALLHFGLLQFIHSETALTQLVIYSLVGGVFYLGMAKLIRIKNII